MNKLIVTVTVTALLLAACGSSVGRRVDSGEIVVPEMSSEDLLVSSLEYLLQDGEDASEEKEEAAEAGTPGEPDEDAADQESGEDEGHRPEQGAVPKENEARIYYSNAGSYDLKQEVIQIKEKTAEELLNALAKHNIVSLDTKVLSFEEETGSQGTVLRLDLSRALNEYLKTMSKEAECIILASVVNTFLENYDAGEIFITVNGKTLTTEHASYAEAFRQCAPEDLLKVPETSEAEDIQEVEGVQPEEDIQEEEGVQSEKDIQPEEDIQEEENVQAEEQERDGE